MHVLITSALNVTLCETNHVSKCSFFCHAAGIARLERQEQARLAKFHALEEDVQAQGLVARLVAGMFSRVQQQMLQEDLDAIRHQQAAVAQGKSSCKTQVLPLYGVLSTYHT